MARRRRVTEIHVVPIDDTILHTADCECCQPILDPDGFWIHNSADKREQYERQGHRDDSKEWGLMCENERGKLELLEE